MRTEPVERNEVGAAAQLLAHLVDVLSGPVQGTHRAIAGTVFRILGRAAVPVKVVHNAISDVSYGGVRVGVHAAADLVGGVSQTLPPERVSHAVTATAAGSVLVGAVNGLLGDALVTEGNQLAVEFGPHHQRKIVGNETALLAQAHPAATDHVVVFVHGLGETEQAWWYRHEGRGSHGERLAELGATPVVLRYNTGRTIAENGAALSELIAALGERWPLPLRRIDLVGHSMGGLVVREACHHAGSDAWRHLVHTACYLGTPHEGATLAIGAHRLAAALRRRPETRAWAELLDVRSAGIDDLRRASRLPLTSGIRHVGVAATLGADPQAWWAGAVGDGLVSLRSARGPLDELHVLPRTGHLALLSHPRVSEVLAELVVWDSDPGEVEANTATERA